MLESIGRKLRKAKLALLPSAATYVQAPSGLLRRIRSAPFVARGAVLRVGKGRIEIAPDAEIGPHVSLDASRGGVIKIGSRARLQQGCVVLTYGSTIELGPRCTLNQYSVVYGAGDIIIGSDTRIAAHSVITSSNHGFADASLPIVAQGVTKEGISIGSDCWIGAGARILDGVKIGDGAVIGAGSVVTGDIPGMAVAYGVPARVKKSRLAQQT